VPPPPTEVHVHWYLTCPPECDLLEIKTSRLRDCGVLLVGIANTTAPPPPPTTCLYRRGKSFTWLKNITVNWPWYFSCLNIWTITTYLKFFRERPPSVSQAATCRFVYSPAVGHTVPLLQLVGGTRNRHTASGVTNHHATEAYGSMDVNVHTF
jgi:hypothetical protein